MFVRYFLVIGVIAIVTGQFIMLYRMKLLETFFYHVNLDDTFEHYTELDNERNTSNFVSKIEESNIDNNIDLNSDNLEETTIGPIIHYLSKIYKNLEGLLPPCNRTSVEITPYSQLYYKWQEDELISQFKNTLSTLSNYVINNNFVSNRKVSEYQNSKAPMHDNETREECLDKSNISISSLLYQHSLPNCGAILMKRPRSIEYLWEEYDKIPSD